MGKENNSTAGTCCFDFYDLSPVGYISLNEQGLILAVNLDDYDSVMNVVNDHLERGVIVLLPLRSRRGRMTHWGSTLRFRRSSRWPTVSETRVTSRRLSISIVGDLISTHAHSGRTE